MHLILKVQDLKLMDLTPITLFPFGDIIRDLITTRVLFMTLFALYINYIGYLRVNQMSSKSY